MSTNKTFILYVFLQNSYGNNNESLKLYNGLER